MSQPYEQQPYQEGQRPQPSESAAQSGRGFVRRAVRIFAICALLVIAGGAAYVLLTPEGAELWQQLFDPGAEEQRLAAEKLRQAGAIVIQRQSIVSSVSFRPIQGRQINSDDETLAYLEDLPSLESLDLAFTDVGDDQLRHIAKLRHLASVILTGTKITDNGLVHLRKLTALQGLQLGATAVTDDGLENLAALTDLRVLDLSNTRVTDEGLKHLKPLRKLQHLVLSNVEITDAGLQILAEVSPSLGRLTLHGTKVTAEGIEQLRQRLVQYYRDKGETPPTLHIDGP